MLEIRDLVKVYKTKGGAEVRALDGVSARFQDTGMVFLLGKSGSGKSTLLNLCGGLDAPDSGEIIIKGRSSKDFSQSDFDSYRNTFVGFVFQEYNILEEFTVEENIALALELQGNNKNKERVNAILEQVDLAGYAKRKPNTISGGERQRVAIARALVKNPEIIMADEPTGALDSNTGKQVFETLKRLSAEKLVIVVSHDRDFAEIYGDRIIELKDGKIISDVSKTKIAADHADDNIRFVGSETISIKSGAKLTADDLERINRFLVGAREDVIITTGRQEVADFRKATHIDEEGARETFETTDETSIAAKTYSPEESRFIRSRLPLRHALRIGASSLKVKPVRLIFTILLSFIAFTMFGLFSTMTFFNKAEVSYSTYTKQNYELLRLKNNYHTTRVDLSNGKIEQTLDNALTTTFTEEDLADIRASYHPDALGVLDTSYASPINVVKPYGENYYSADPLSFAELGEDDSYWQQRLLTDTDLSALGSSDIVISSYMFDSYRYLTMYDPFNQENTLPIETHEDIVGRTLLITSADSDNNISLTIRGVYRYDPPSEYDIFREEGYIIHDREDAEREALIRRMQLDFQYGRYSTALVSEAFRAAHYDALDGGTKIYPDYAFRSLGYSLMVYAGTPEEGLSTEIGYINSLPNEYGVPPTAIARFDGKTADTPLEPGEAIVPYKLLSDQFIAIKDAIYNEKILSDGQNAADAWNIETGTKLGLLNAGSKFKPKATAQDYAISIQTAAELMNAAEGTENALLLDVTGKFPASDTLYPFKIVGYYYGDMNVDHQGVFISEEDFADIYPASFTGPLFESEGSEYSVSDSFRVTKYRAPDNRFYSGIIVPVPESPRVFRALLRGEGAVSDTDDTFYTINSAVSAEIDSAVQTIDMLGQIFLYAGIVIALFAILLLFNFISVSITNKRKEIGILRAVGARSADIFKIFFAESAIITAACYVIAVIACYILCGVLNTQISAVTNISLFIFGPLSWLVMLAIAVFTSLVATFLPVYSFTKRKPVESIRAL